MNPAKHNSWQSTKLSQTKIETKIENGQIIEFLLSDSFVNCQELCLVGVIQLSQNIPRLSLACIYNMPNLIWWGIKFGCYTGTLYWWSVVTPYTCCKWLNPFKWDWLCSVINHKNTQTNEMCHVCCTEDAPARVNLINHVMFFPFLQKQHF